MWGNLHMHFYFNIIVLELHEFTYRLLIGNGIPGLMEIYLCTVIPGLIWNRHFRYKRS